MKTINLKRPRRWFDLSTPACASICMFAILTIAALATRLHTAPATVAVPTPALPTSQAIVVIQRESVPTAQPAPTPDQAVYADLAALQARISELEAQQVIQPEAIEQPAQVIYVASQALATPEAPYAPTDAPLLVATPVWATSAPVRPEDFVIVDSKARCQFIGCL
jgi:hypothetical protein